MMLYERRCCRLQAPGAQWALPHTSAWPLPIRSKAGKRTSPQHSARHVSVSQINGMTRLERPAATAAVEPVVAPLPEAKSSKSGVVIVGGGPSGLGAALLLAKRGWQDITVLEQRSAFDTADADKSYVYMVDGRSRKLLDQFALAEEIPRLGHLTTDMNVTCAHPDGKMTKKHFPIKDMSNVAHYMPRAVLLTLLADAAKANSAIRLVSSANVTVTREQRQVVIKADVRSPSASNGNGSSGSTDSGSSGSITLRPTLLLGCDGLRSAVRSALAEWEKQDNPGSDRFSMVHMPSPSSGLRFKMLQLPPNPVMRNGERLPNNNFAIIYSRHKPMRLSMLPVHDPASNRPANLFGFDDNPLWSINDAESMYAYMEDHYPQMDVRALVPPEVMAHFAASKGGSFPTPQYSNALTRVMQHAATPAAPAPAASTAAPAAAVASGPAAVAWSAAAAGSGSAAGSAGQGAAASSGSEGVTGVVLLGDAAHAFPPDMGAGVNSALEDVDVFGEALAQTGDDVASALPLYEERRRDDVRALVRIVQIGGPYQYGVQLFAKALWQMRFLGLMALNKVLPAIFHPPIMIMVQKSDLAYSEILRRAEESARRVKALAAALVALVVAVALRV